MPSLKLVTATHSLIIFLVISAGTCWGALTQKEIRDAKEAVSEMNKGLPKMTSSEIQLTRVSWRGDNEIAYIFKDIIHTKNQFVPAETIKPTHVNGLCSAPDTSKTIKKGMKYTYVFYDKLNLYVYEYSITARDCDGLVPASTGIFNEVIEKAEGGDALAQNELGLMYVKGEGIEQDKNKAAEWWTKSAEQGYAKAQYNIGMMFFKGEGIENKKKAAKWFTKAAEQGLTDAQNTLGMMYFTGEGMEKDNVEAYKWFLKAAKQGHARAQYNMGLIYYKGEALAQDKTEAYKWWMKAAEQGNQTAKHDLEILCKESPLVCK
jgi:hypothetical protein